MADKGEESKVT